jgi:hypothetical protein
MKWLWAVCLVMGVTGCTPYMREQIDYAIYKERQRWAARDRLQDTKDFFDFDRTVNSFSHQEREAEKRICFHPDSQRRVTMQDGVNDRVNYTWCVMQPYDGEGMGQRMQGRPG